MAGLPRVRAACPRSTLHSTLGACLDLPRRLLDYGTAARTADSTDVTRHPCRPCRQAMQAGHAHMAPPLQVVFSSVPSPLSKAVTNAAVLPRQAQLCTAVRHRLVGMAQAAVHLGPATKPASGCDVLWQAGMRVIYVQAAIEVTPVHQVHPD